MKNANYNKPFHINDFFNKLLSIDLEDNLTLEELINRVEIAAKEVGGRIEYLEQNKLIVFRYKSLTESYWHTLFRYK